MVGATTVVKALVLDGGLIPSVNPVAAPIVVAAAAAAVVAVEAGIEVIVAVAAPRGLSIKDKPPPAAVVAVGAVLGAEAGGAVKLNPDAVAGAAAVMMGEAKSVGPAAGAAWMVAGGAGVDEGLIPKAKPPPWPVMAAVVETGWARAEGALMGALVPKEKPPPPSPPSPAPPAAPAASAAAAAAAAAADGGGAASTAAGAAAMGAVVAVAVVI